MDSERSNITILVVDHDEVSLAFVANILIARQYKVQTAKNAHDALVTLRANEGLFDIIITEFHVLGMDGFVFQKHVQDQFQIPVIMMSKDNRQHIISRTLENGATLFIVKPVCAEDFRDIWKYVVEAKKHKLFIDNLFLTSDEESSEESNTKKYCKRKSIDESPKEEKCQLLKRASRLVWTTELHNLFIDAVKKLGLKNATPNKILEKMNIRGLTRENISSHMQKYRLFLEKVVEEGTIADISHKAPSSTFASNIPISMIKEIQEMRTKKLRTMTFYKIGNENNVNIFNHFPSSNNEFPYMHQGLTLQNLDQVRLGKPNLETNGFASTRFSPYGSRQGLMAASSSNFLRRDFEFGETNNQNHGSIGNGYFNHINHGVKNWNLESWNNSNILAQNVTCDARNNNPFGIKNNNIFEMGGIGTMNKRGFDSVGIRDDNANSINFGLNVGGQNANVSFGSIGHENFGLVQGGFVGSRNGEAPLQISDRNIVENEQSHNGGTSTNVEFNISNFSMAEDMNHFYKMNENNDASSFLKSDFINSTQDVQHLDQQLYNGGGDTSLDGNTSCVLNGSPISVNQNSMQLQGNEQFSNGEAYDMFMGDNASTSATNPKLDMDLFEAVFGTTDNKLF